MLITLIRNPVDYFLANYHVKSYYGSTPETIPVDRCVSEKYPECWNNTFSYLGFICGEDQDNSELCIKNMAHEIDSENKRRSILERARIFIARQYYVVGIVENFDSTLKLLEKILPGYFRGSYKLFQTSESVRKHFVDEYVGINKASNATKLLLKTSVLRYEYDLYLFARAKFEMQLIANQINLNPNNSVTMCLLRKRKNC